jgi:hypothetical protein
MGCYIMKSSATVSSTSLAVPYFLYLSREWRCVNISVGLSSYTYLFSCPILNKLDLDQQILVEILIVKFHENLSCKRRNFPCGQTHEQTDITNSIVTTEIWKIESSLGEVTFLETEGKEF